MRVELNDAFVRALKPPARGQIDLRDTLVPCLTLRITHTGTAPGRCKRAPATASERADP